MKRSTQVILKIFMALGFLFGLGMLVYPLFSNMWNDYNDKLKFEEYKQTAQEKFVDEGLVSEWEEARAYNDRLQPMIIPDSFIKNENMVDDTEYQTCLNIRDDGEMGYIYLPKINQRIPIYHTTSEDVLQKGVGHMQGSSLPVGGESTHAALAAHRGLPGASLFTDLDLLEEGDQFYLYILDDILAYQVDKISIVEPTKTDDLSVRSGEDHVTLVTCTPYGVNTHRLLVRGTRVPYEEAQMTEQETHTVKSVHTNYGLWIVIGLTFTIIMLLTTASLVKRANRKKQWKQMQMQMQMQMQRQMQMQNQMPYYYYYYYNNYYDNNHDDRR